MGSRKTRSLSRSEKRRRARRITLISVIALLVLLVTLPLWSSWVARICGDEMVQWSDGFIVQRTQITGNHMLTTDQIAELADIPKGVSLFRVPVNAAKVRIESNPWIKSAVVRRRLPDTIEICVVEREPVAAVRCDRLLMITLDSVALAPVSDNWVWDLPLLTPIQPIRLRDGATVTDSSTLVLLREALTVRAVSKDAWHNLSELYYSDGQIHAALTHPSADVLLGHGTTELAWVSALKILNTTNARNPTRIQSIDLRIPGKIIVAENPAIGEGQTHG